MQYQLLAFDPNNRRRVYRVGSRRQVWDTVCDLRARALPSSIYRILVLRDFVPVWLWRYSDSGGTTKKI